jgi:hypothetical protein
MSLRNLFAITALVIVGASFAACSKSTTKTAATPTSDTKGAAEGDSHADWWCYEHGVPEEVCALCDSTLVADFKAKGDWCEKHNRPDSQCFACHPEKEAEFAARYEAKFGEKPPKPTDNGPEQAPADEGKKS